MCFHWKINSTENTKPEVSFCIRTLRSRQLSSWSVYVSGVLLGSRNNNIFSHRYCKIQNKRTGKATRISLLASTTSIKNILKHATHQETNIRRSWKSQLCHHSALILSLSTSLQKFGSTFPSTTCVRAHCNVPRDQPARSDIKLGSGAGISPGAEAQLANLKWLPAQGKCERSVRKELV